MQYTLDYQPLSALVSCCASMYSKSDWKITKAGKIISLAALIVVSAKNIGTVYREFMLDWGYFSEENIH